MQVVDSRIETIVDRLDLAPRRDVAFFRDIAIPADLPVFTIKDRLLAGSNRPEPIGGDQEKTKLADVASRVANEEKRYTDVEVKAGVNYKYVNSIFSMAGAVDHESREERSVLRGSLAYFSSHEMSATLAGERTEQFRVEAFDGQWIRGLTQWKGDGPGLQGWASLTKGGKEKAEGATMACRFTDHTR